MLDNIYHLFARHAELAQDQAFLIWLRENGVAYWYDTAPADGDVSVVVVSRDETNLFAAREKAVDDTPDEGKLLPDLTVVQTGRADLTELPPREAALRSGIAKYGFSRRNLISIRPSVQFADDAVVLEGWDIRVASEREYRFLSSGDDLALVFEGERYVPDEGRRPLIRPMADDLADNELHTSWAFRQEALTWAPGPLTISEKARRIGAQVSRTYAYDSSINLISEFTWRDTLTRDRNGRRGICDEYAVVEISYLRSLGIPARLKFLVWTDAAGTAVGHACVEFSENGVWQHLDGLWNAFKNPGIYRQSGARNLTVMDGDYPLDSRSDQPAWGKPDIRSDGLLHPYGDFILNPKYPGNSRAGYSF